MDEIKKLAAHIRLSVKDRRLLDNIQIIENGTLVLKVNNPGMVELAENLLDTGLGDQIVAVSMINHFVPRLLDIDLELLTIEHLEDKANHNDWNNVADEMMVKINTINTLKSLRLDGKLWVNRDHTTYNLDGLTNLEHLELRSEPAKDIDNWLDELQQLISLKIQPSQSLRQFPASVFELPHLKELLFFKSPKLLNTAIMPPVDQQQKIRGLQEQLLSFTINNQNIKGNFMKMANWIQTTYGRETKQIQRVKSHFERSIIIPWQKLLN